jgi:hypothetical protein
MASIMDSSRLMSPLYTLPARFDYPSDACLTDDCVTALAIAAGVVVNIA